MPHTGKLKYFEESQIDAAFGQSTSRLYLTGKLHRPQEALEHFGDITPESGLSVYSSYKAELPHMHLANTEFNYVLTGQLKVLLLENGEEHHFHAGDMFIIEPNMPYCIKAIANTKVLFFKSPGGDDKQLIELDNDIEHWRESWGNTVST